MYRLRCETCGETETVDDLETAQERFNDHAAERHEVEMTKVEPVPESVGDAPADGRSVDG